MELDKDFNPSEIAIQFVSEEGLAGDFTLGKDEYSGWNIFRHVYRWCTSHSRLQKRVESVAFAVIQNHLGEDFELSKYQFERVLKLACRDLPGLRRSELHKIDTFKRVINHIKENIEVAGTSIPVYENSDSTNDDDVVKTMKYLLGDGKFPFHRISVGTLLAIVLKKNPNLLSEMKEELQSGFMSLWDGLKTEKGKDQLTESLIGNMLALIPFTEPEDGKIWKVPQKINGQWQLVEFSSKAICLTPDWAAHDPYHAYSMLPQNNDIASPLLLFMGTPQPTASGFSVASWTDWVPGYAVGESLYSWFAEEKIKDCLRSHNENGHKTRLYGQSLGASLSLLTVANSPGLVESVSAYGAPSPTASTRQKYQENCEGLEEKPKVSIYWNDNDPVGFLGSGWHKDWSLYRVLPAKKTDGFSAHARAVVGQTGVLLWKAQSKPDSRRWKRFCVSLTHQLLSVPMFFLQSISIGGQVAFHQSKNCTLKKWDQVNEQFCLSE